MITAEYYEKRTGEKPRNDDLERCNCDRQGEVGHWQCGWNKQKDLPVFMVGREGEFMQAGDDFVQAQGDQCVASVEKEILTCGVLSIDVFKHADGKYTVVDAGIVRHPQLDADSALCAMAHYLQGYAK